MKPLRILAILCVLAAGNAARAQKSSAAEQADLRQAIGEAGNSTLDLMKAIEAHLAKYPDSANRAELERALVKGAIETKDDPRVILYGERVLARTPNDIQILDNVARALLASGDADAPTRALRDAQRYESLVHGMEAEQPSAGPDAARHRDELDRGLGRALMLQSMASARLGRPADAVKLARRAFEAFPSEEFARQLADSLAADGKTAEAIRSYADALTIPDARAGDSDRARDRKRMGELYQAQHGSEKGLGDTMLEAYDQTSALIARRREAIRQFDPNAGLTDPMQFTLSGIGDSKLKLASLIGKVLVMDFWATWCAPCRVQHPLYEQVRQRFKDRDDVVFLSIDTDEDHQLVRPYVQENHWSAGSVYFEDGLARALRVANIPTTLVFDKHGKMASRMDGFLPDRFVDMLTDRIRDAAKACQPPCG